MFELTVLFAALTAFIGMLAMNALPSHHHPLFRSERFRRATQDRLFITIESRDPNYEETRVRAFLEALGSVHVERVEAGRTEPMPRIPMPPLKPLPGWVWPALAILTVLSFLPITLIARERSTRVDRPRIQIIPDMDQQPKFKAQAANAIFADGRADRPPVAGAVARGEARIDDHFYRGIAGDRWAETFPMTLTPEILRRGQERFGIYCAPCHGLSGYGDGIVNVRAERLAEGTWVPPTSLTIRPSWGVR